MAAEAQKTDDPYGGFNDFDHAYDLGNVYEDAEFMRAVARSSHSRRPATASRQQQMDPRKIVAAAQNRPPTATALRSSLASRRGEIVRPMTAVRGAGYTSAGRKSTFDGIKGPTINSESPEETVIKKIRQLENQVKDLLVESIMASDQKNFKQALDKAKEAGRKEQQVKKMREQNSLPDNPDLSFSAQFTLACQYISNNMYNDALNVYQVILKEEKFENAKRLKVNIGNIYFRKKDYAKAVKYYRMALDRVQKVHERTRTKILGNIGVALIKLGRYEDALAAFEECLDSNGDYGSALNLVLAAYCLEDTEKMREAFQRLVDIPAMVDDDHKFTTEQDILVIQLMNSDVLRQWERRRKQVAENNIMAAAKIISRQIAPTFSEGYAWCVETIKNSVYAGLAIELEMNKAVDMLKQGDLEGATEALTAFNNKDSKVSSSAANNLAMINLMKGKDKLTEATQLAEQALSLDRYNANALVNRGNIYYLMGEHKFAIQCYKEALQVEPSCIQAIYNTGLISREIGDFEGALSSFYKLNNMLMNNAQVLTQLASIAQALELYSQASSLVPSDPAILSKLGEIYDNEGDKSQAFQCNYESYRSYPPNIEVIKWLGNYYVDAQFAEKAVRYFERAMIMEPHNIEWPLLMAGCQRRSGNFQKALDIYRQIHRRFPNNIECLKFLVQLCHDLRLPEKKEYEDKLKKIERVNQLRMQRESDSSQNRRLIATSNSVTSSSSRSLNATRQEMRSASANLSKSLLETNEPYQATKIDLNTADFSYNDPIGPGPQRPKTGLNDAADPFDMHDVLADELLPE
ncbi:hypothetical protein M3Y97_00367200 [Aphelenchoides bicaudatus]|nr:hypothetical protein M3Y97_00367200 [Aphelenchoides bicaudatus]